MKIYVASSWRNIAQASVVAYLRELGHDAYDFRNPDPKDTGFHWRDIDPEWRSWTAEQYADALNDPRATAAWDKDMSALFNCDACVLVLPCGRSAHLEAGYAAALGRPVIAYIPPGEPVDPELMYKLFKVVTDSLDVVRDTLTEVV